VFQFFNLVPTLTALENVEIIAELTGKDSARRSREALARVGLSDIADRFPVICPAFSNGCQSRVPSSRSRHCCGWGIPAGERRGHAVPPISSVAAVHAVHRRGPRLAASAARGGQHQNIPGQEPGPAEATQQPQVQPTAQPYRSRVRPSGGHRAGDPLGQPALLLGRATHRHHILRTDTTRAMTGTHPECVRQPPPRWTPAEFRLVAWCFLWLSVF
jgi:hypothetical protein